MAKRRKKSLRDRLPYSEVIIDLIERLAVLPGIGEKSAERLAYHIIALESADALALSRAIANVKKKMRFCSSCFNLTENELCEICSSAGRTRTTVCVVEQPRDLWAIEKSGSYKGLYHVLLGKLSPLEGIAEKDLTLA